MHPYDLDWPRRRPRARPPVPGLLLWAVFLLGTLVGVVGHGAVTRDVPSLAAPTGMLPWTLAPVPGTERERVEQAEARA